MEKLNGQQIEKHLNELDGWSYDGSSIHKTFTFKDFKAAFAFMARVAFEAEAHGHHPNWENVYNRVVIHLNTHDVGGITRKDFELAEAISEL